MSYNPTNWSTGDIVSAEKLNKIEHGIVEAASSGGGSGPLVVTFSDKNHDIYRFVSNVLSTDITAALNAKRPVDMYLEHYANGTAVTHYIEKINYIWDMQQNTFVEGQNTLLSGTRTCVLSGLEETGAAADYIEIENNEGYLCIEFPQPQE